MVTKCSRCRDRGGFTLIELLVVIAIISILAAILFPVFAQAKRAATKAATTSNVRQISMAVLMYAGDHDDALPRTMDESGGFPETISWWAVSNYQNALRPYLASGRGAVDAGGREATRQQVWYDALDPDRNVPAMWGSFANNGFLTGMNRVMSSVESPASTIYSALRGSPWSVVIGVAPPNPLPLNDPSDPFWTSEFFDICFDPWTADRDATHSPYHFSRGRAAPPCTLFPEDPWCEDWNYALDGEWNADRDGLPRRREMPTRYGRMQIFSYLDGSARVQPFVKTYSQPGEDHWSIVKGQS